MEQLPIQTTVCVLQVSFDGHLDTGCTMHLFGCWVIVGHHPKFQLLILIDRQTNQPAVINAIVGLLSNALIIQPWIINQLYREL